jgi:two-component system, NarL family, response regulator LiaR
MALPVGVGIIADRKTTGAALSEIIEGDKELLLIGITSGGPDGYDLLKNRALRVLLVNLSLSEHHGMPASGVVFIRDAKSLRPDVGIVSLKRRVDEHQLRAALDAGADACCLATTAGERLCKAIKVVADGATWLDAEISRALFHHPTQVVEVGGPTLHLSPREHDVLQLIVEGYSNEEIAALLKRSAPTVRTHLAHLYRKLGVNDRVSAAVHALRHGLV